MTSAIAIPPTVINRVLIGEYFPRISVKSLIILKKLEIQSFSRLEDRDLPLLGPLDTFFWVTPSICSLTYLRYNKLILLLLISSVLLTSLFL